ncbi:uncharacterized protein BDV17DRAFT_196286 [Aspergillus undulatus]|uniref:uncharacterized protein n=1 Tax=Aspergillus undulatus TaxID=1810928 RepID=UPI003CCD95D9
MSFLALPPDIRFRIYPLLLDPNTYSSSYKHLNRRAKEAYDNSSLPSAMLPRFHVTRKTPSILLLNKLITAEALPVLYSKEMTLYATPSTYFVFRQMDIAEFICETLLERMRFVVLRLKHPENLFVFSLLDIWGRDCLLERLVVFLPKREVRDEYGIDWDIVESRLWMFADVVGIDFQMREVDNPLEDGK